MKSCFKYMVTEKGLKIRTGFWASHEPSPYHVVLLQGRASCMEKFQTVIAELQQRHFNVWSFDWRGQGLSSRLLPNHNKGHVGTYEDYLQDMHQFISEIVRPQPTQTYIFMGQSMGAHLAMRYLQSYENRFSGALLISPMFDILTGFYPRSFVKFLAKTAKKFGWSNAYAWSQGDYDPKKEPFQGNYLSTNAERYQKHLDFQNNNPALTIGGVTYGWLQATFESTKILLEKAQLKKINIPVLMIQSGEEWVVDNKWVPEVARSLKQGMFKTYEAARHQIFLENDAIQNLFWQDFEDFIEKVLLLKTYKNFSQSISQKSLSHIPVVIRSPFLKPLSPY